MIKVRLIEKGLVFEVEPEWNSRKLLSFLRISF
jgi:hypothetical protein